MSSLIGLGGKLRAGKDAVADYLVKNKNYVKMGMSDALNDALLVLNPWVQLDFDVIPVKPWEAGLRRGKYHKGEIIRYADLHAAVGYTEAKRHGEVRRLLQVLGTEVGRDMIHPDVWVNIAEEKIKSYWAEGKNVVITAMRFPNELEMLERLGGTSVWVNRPSEAHSGSENTISSHDSENSVSEDDFKHIIDNDGTLEDLYARVELVLGVVEPKSTHQGYWGDPILRGVGFSHHAKSHEAARDWPPYDR